MITISSNILGVVKAKNLARIEIECSLCVWEPPKLTHSRSDAFWSPRVLFLWFDFSHLLNIVGSDSRHPLSQSQKWGYCSQSSKSNLFLPVFDRFCCKNTLWNPVSSGKIRVIFYLNSKLVKFYSENHVIFLEKIFFRFTFDCFCCKIILWTLVSSGKIHTVFCLNSKLVKFHIENDGILLVIFSYVIE